MSEVALVLCIFLAAALYSSVGHGGASAYIAIMGLFSVPYESIRQASFLLNIFVASIGLMRFYRAGHFSWKVFWPFAIMSAPAAYLGGSLGLPAATYKILVGFVLMVAAIRLLWKPNADLLKPVPLPLALVCGAAVGLLSGLTGTGGGIFLSPILIVMGWTDTKKSAGVCAGFILTNSIAGMLGLLSKTIAFPPTMPYWIAAAVAGGLIGSEFGSNRLTNSNLCRLLAVVLLVAGWKFAVM